jgi:hypothetical protein
MIAIDNKQVTKKLFEYMIIIIKNTIKVMRDTMNDWFFLCISEVK